MARQVVAKEGFNFSDGTTIPYGSFLTVPGNNVNSDPGLEHNPPGFEIILTFQKPCIRALISSMASAFRECARNMLVSARARNPMSLPSTWSPQVQTTSSTGTDATHVPGGTEEDEPRLPLTNFLPRFFAATQLKTALPHVLINYDIKAETDGVRPPDHEFSLFRVPNTLGKIYIQKRI
jgi:hypothetical protein